MDVDRFIEAYRDKIRFTYDNTNIFLNAKDVGKVLGHSNIRRILTNIPESERKKFVCDTEGGPRLFTHISSKALVQILCVSRKSASIEMSRVLGIEGTQRVIPMETSTLHQIQTALSSFKTKFQHKCGPYFIDLYFEDFKVAVECDEPNHKHQQVEDRHRQTYLETNLECEFIRYNPCTDGFSIFEVISEILSKILASMKRPE
jgi:very-short-patch-repair endonuclease